MMVAAIAEAASTDSSNPKVLSQREILQNSRRPLLSDNAAAPRKPKVKDVLSRYMSPSPSTSTSSSSSSSRRCSSPVPSRTAVLPPIPYRSKSVDRYARPAIPVPPSRDSEPGGVSAISKLLFTSTRSLSVSFQGESFSLPISKTKDPPSNFTRKVTPERRRIITASSSRGKVDDSDCGDQAGNSKPRDHRWPGKIREAATSLSVSLDCTHDKKNNMIGLKSSSRVLRPSLVDDARCSSFDGRLSFGSAGEIVNAVPSDLTASDTDSFSSGSTSGSQRQNPPRGIARLWHETNSRFRSSKDPGPRSPSSPNLRRVALPRPSSPCKPGTPLPIPPSSKRVPSPSRHGNEASPVASTSCAASSPSILRLSPDLRRGKAVDMRNADVHALKILQNGLLRWRFAKATADASISKQRRITQRCLWNTSIALSNLRQSVKLKRIESQLQKQKSKITTVLNEQMSYLEEWSLFDRSFTLSLNGVIENLWATTLHLPIVGCAMVDVQTLKNVLGSSISVMQGLTSSICLNLSKMEEVNSLLARLEKLKTKEQALLSQSNYYASIIEAMQVKDWSLNAHILQVNGYQRQLDDPASGLLSYSDCPT